MALGGCATGGLSDAAGSADAHRAWIERCGDWDDWDEPGLPFRIYGNSYYVGTCGITAILVAGDQGHVLIDGGTAAGADAVAANIVALGFALTDVRLLLHSHEHFDHVAGLARLQQVTGARLLASAAAAPVLSSGVAAPDDPQAGMHEPFPAARVDGLVREGVAVVLGSLALTPIATPGHTPGALSWRWESCDGERCLPIVYADSLSPLSRDDYRFSDHPAYVAAFRAGLEKLAALDCAILITPHPSASDLRTRLGSPDGLVDRGRCAAYAAAIAGRLAERLATEAESSTP